MAYRSHIETLHKKDPYLVIPYIYHLYLGLLSGGQVLKEKRRLAAGFKEKVGLGGGQQKQEGEAVTDFGDRSISRWDTF